MKPDYLICLECETPCYTFEWAEDEIKEVLCASCGNDDPEKFAYSQESDTQ